MFLNGMRRKKIFLFISLISTLKLREREILLMRENFLFNKVLVPRLAS